MNIEREIQMTKYSYQRLSTQDKQSFLRQEKYARDHDIPTKNWIQEKQVVLERIDLNYKNCYLF